MRWLVTRRGWSAVVGGAAVLLWLVALARFYDPVFGLTAWFQLDASSEATMVPEARARPVYVHRVEGGYDGQYYAQLAARPNPGDPAVVAAMDNAGYRARRILGSAVAWVLAGGDGVRALDVYAALNPACWLALAALWWWRWRPDTVHGVVAWAGLMFSAGAIASVRLALTDLPALLLVVGAAVAVERQRLTGAAGWLAAAALERETALLTAPMLATGRWRGVAGRAVLVVVPLALWYGWLRWRFGAGADGWENFTWPGAAWLQKWRVCLGDLDQVAFRREAWTALLVLVGISVQALWLMLRPAWQQVWWRLGAGHVALMFGLGWAAWEGYPGAVARVLLPLHAAFNALVPRTRAGLMLLLAGNLGVVGGIYGLGETPQRTAGDWAVGRAGGAVYQLTLDTGWHAPEGSGARRWCWAGRAATVGLQGWRQPVVPVTLEFELSAFGGPRTIAVTQGARVLWEGVVNGKPQWVAVPGVTWVEGKVTVLTLTSVEPAQQEIAAPGARMLAFSLGRVRFGP